MQTMAVKVTGTEAVFGALDRAADILKEEILLQLTYLGEECVKMAREDHPGNWRDQTGNLRSSVGYAIFDYGREVMQSAFQTVGTGTAGSTKGAEYVKSLASQYAQTYALVVVAGMEYAEFVELKRDVLQGAEAKAKQIVNERVRRAVEVAATRINKLMK